MMFLLKGAVACFSFSSAQTKIIETHKKGGICPTFRAELGWAYGTKKRFFSVGTLKSASTKLATGIRNFMLPLQAYHPYHQL